MRVLGYPYSTLGSRFSDSVLYTATQWANDHHGAIQKFLLATREAATYIAAHEGESAKLIADFAGIDVSSLANIRPLTRSVPLRPGDLQPMIDAAAKYKLIPQSFPAGQIICTCALHK
jgi:ABC-type nitrate/sulfonate/bicarbonate transport system substrate-binding protein